MNDGMNIIERAHELARSGECATPDDVRKALEAEGFEAVRQHLQGPMIKRQLRKLCLESMKARRERASGIGFRSAFLNGSSGA